jgi:hypothetical protein
MHAGLTSPLVVSALAGLALEVNQILYAPAGAARDDVEVSGYALYTAAAVELEASPFPGGWVRGLRGRLIHVNTPSVLAAPPGSLDPPAGASYVVNNRIISFLVWKVKPSSV